MEVLEEKTNVDRNYEKKKIIRPYEYIIGKENKGLSSNLFIDKKIVNIVDEMMKEKYIDHIMKIDDDQIFRWDDDQTDKISVVGDIASISKKNYTAKQKIAETDDNFDDYVFYEYIKFLFKKKIEEKILKFGYDFDDIYLNLVEKLSQQGHYKILRLKSRLFFVYLMEQDIYESLIKTVSEKELNIKIDEIYKKYKKIYDDNLDKSKKIYLRLSSILSNPFSNPFSNPSQNLTADEDLLKELQAYYVGGVNKKSYINKLILFSKKINTCVNKKCKNNLEKVKKKFNLSIKKYLIKILNLNKKFKKDILKIYYNFMNNNDINKYIKLKKNKRRIDSILYNKYNIILKKLRISIKNKMKSYNKIFKNYKDKINKLKQNILSSKEYKNLNKCNFKKCRNLHINSIKLIKKFTKLLCNNKKLYCNIYNYLLKINIDKLNFKQNLKLIKLIKQE